MPFSKKTSRSKSNRNISQEICSLLLFPGLYLLLFPTLFITNYETKLRRRKTEGVRKTLDYPPQGTFSTNLSPSCTKHNKLSYSPTRTQGESDRYRSRQVVIIWYGKFSHQLECVRCQGAPYKQRSSVQVKGLGTNSNLSRNARWVLPFSCTGLQEKS